MAVQILKPWSYNIVVIKFFNILTIIMVTEHSSGIIRIVIMKLHCKSRVDFIPFLKFHRNAAGLFGYQDPSLSDLTYLLHPFSTRNSSNYRFTVADSFPFLLSCLVLILRRFSSRSISVCSEGYMGSPCCPT